MKTLEAFQAKGQANIHRLVNLGKQQSVEVQTWGVTAAAAVVGGLVMAAGARGLVAVLSTLAAPSVSFTLGAIGGGLLAWRYLQQQKATDAHSGAANDPEPQAIAIEPVVEESQTPGALTPIEATSGAADSVSESIAQVIAIEPVGEAVIAPAIDIGDATVALEATNTNDPILPATASEPPPVALVTPAAITMGEADSVEDNVAADPANTTVIAARTDGEVIAMTILLRGESPAAAPPTAEVSEQPTAPDRLETINGIGRASAKRLHKAGILTYGQLAALTPEQLQALMGAGRGSQRINAEDWIMQARQLASSAI